MDANSQIGFALNHIANFNAAMVQMNLHRFWSETLAEPRYADPKRLLRHGFKVYSQHDEDGIIQEIFRRIGTSKRTFVEFGVETGVECNTVKLLIEGWRGLWIEANAQACKAIGARFEGFLKDRRLTLSQSFVTAENIDTLIKNSGLSGEIDLLSIDIDFNDYWIWKAIESISPRVVVIEYNAGLRPPLSLTVPYRPNHAGDGTNFFGASSRSFGAARHYEGISRCWLQYLRIKRLLCARRPLCRPLRRAGDSRRTLRTAAAFLLAVVCRAARATTGPIRLSMRQKPRSSVQKRASCKGRKRRAYRPQGEVAEWLKAAVC